MPAINPIPQPSEPSEPPQPTGVKAYAACIGWGMKLLVLSLLLLEGLYLVLGNLFLGLGGLKRLVSWDPETFTMDYDVAWSLWPGHARVRNFKITGQDTVLQWSMDIEKASVQVELAELFDLRYHATRVSAEGVVFKLRFRVSDEVADSAYARALPPIAGFADPPLAFVGPVLEPTDADYHLWTAHLENIDAQIKEIWVEGYRYTGDMHARSGFYFKPLRKFSLDPSGVEIRSGELQTADHAVLRGMEGYLFASVDPSDMEYADVATMLKATQLHAMLEAQVPGLSFMRSLTGDDFPRFRDGSGALSLDVRVDRGVLSQGSRARYATERLDVDTLDGGATAALEADLRVHEGRTHLSGDVDHATLRWARPSGGPVAVVNGARATLEMPASLLEPWLVEDYALQLPSVRVPDLRRLLPDRQSPVQFTRGSAALRGALSGHRGQPGRGSLHVDVWNAAGSWKQLALGASVGAKIEVEGVDLVGKTATLKGTAGIGKAHVRAGESAYEDWWARARFSGVKVRLGRSIDVRGNAKVAMRDLDPFVGTLVGMDLLPGWSKPLISSKQVDTDVNVNKQGTRLSLGVQAIAGSQRVTGLLERRQDDDRGAFLIESGPLSAGLQLGADGVSVKPFAGGGWLKEQLAALRGWR
ncbi:hypothetical protein [Chondromyces crocatus]|uniref:AsmA-like C-terminal domain-containing protein n=1 Tax=Chondromyces crocatus TaxID=52 RepID=A0A0K1EJN2_CHOCO|nr:hypothetical protein [Chondromyces crocatus]AKT40813.1 uncharacterized protein CMC5_049690 [Chondromyces crocatus]